MSRLPCVTAASERGGRGARYEEENRRVLLRLYIVRCVKAGRGQEDMLSKRTYKRAAFTQWENGDSVEIEVEGNMVLITRRADVIAMGNAATGRPRYASRMLFMPPYQRTASSAM